MLRHCSDAIRAIASYFELTVELTVTYKLGQTLSLDSPAIPMTDLQWQLPLQLIYWAALCSIIALLAHVLLVKFHWFGFGLKVQLQVQNSHTADTHTKVFITNDKWPCVFAVLRFFGCLAIFALSVAEVIVSRPSSFVSKHSKDVILCLVFVRPPVGLSSPDSSTHYTPFRLTLPSYPSLLSSFSAVTIDGISSSRYTSTLSSWLPWWHTLYETCIHSSPIANIL